MYGYKRKINKQGGEGVYRYKMKIMWKGGGVMMWITWVFESICESSCALVCPTHQTNSTDMSSPGASLRTSGDRQHIDKQAFPWHPSTRGQTTRRTWKPSPGTHFSLTGDRLYQLAQARPHNVLVIYYKTSNMVSCRMCAKLVRLYVCI